jgi:uracil-DNA glycosylase family 4
MTIVPGTGNKAARIMLVGEAPAATEVRLGQPFMGRAGEELNKLLAAANIDRNDCYLTNASLTPVRGEKKSFFFPGGSPSPEYIQGIAQLLKDIEEIKPNVVVTLGNYAMWALLQQDGIMKRRGSIYWSNLGNVKVIPTIHPAAIIRGSPDEGEKGQGGMYKMRNPVIWDLQRARQQSAYPDLRLRPRTLLVDPTGLVYEEAIERLRNASRLTYDIESFGGTRLACVGFSDGDPEWAVTLSTKGQRPDRISVIKELLESDVPKVGQNLQYDATMLDQNGIHTKNIVWDTMIAAHILMPDLPKGLHFLNSIYTDIPYYKDEGKEFWKRESSATQEELQKYYLYNAKDVVSTTEIAEYQREELAERNLMGVFRGVMDIFEPMRWATYRGFGINHHRLLELINETIEKRDRAHKELVETWMDGEEINVGSHVQVKKLLYGKLRLSDRKNQSSDAPTILDLAARTGNRAPYLIIAERRANKLLSNYHNTNILSSDGRVRFGFNLVGTFGSRISSSAPLWGPGLNGQNIPIRHGAKTRQMFVADPGYTLLEFDQAQAEAVVVAYLANDPIHMDCFRNNKDVHRVTACLLSGLPTSEWKSIDKGSAIRDLAKTCNHELNYDAGPGQFMMTVNEEYDPDDPESVKMDFVTAKAIRQKYLDTRPALPSYWEYIRAQLKINRTLRTPFGREFQFLDAWSHDLFKRAYSYIPQATVGEITNYGIAQVHGTRVAEYVPSQEQDVDELRRMGIQFLLQVHDSTVWQVPDEAVDSAIPRIQRLLEVPFSLNGYNLCIPIEGAKGKTWYKKDMDDVGKSRTSCEFGNN